MEHGLIDRKGNYDHMFKINTRSRIYYLAVDTRKEMDTWVNMICKACGLRDTSEEEEAAVAGAGDHRDQQQVTSHVTTTSTTLPPSTRPIYANTAPPMPPPTTAALAPAPL